MSQLPLIVSCERDFLIHLVAVPLDAKVSDLIAAASSLVVGAHLPDIPLSTIRVRKIDQTKALPLGAAVLEVGVSAMDWVHLFFEPDTVVGPTIR